MNINEGIYAYLVAQASLTALVGTNPVRLWPQNASEATNVRNGDYVVYGFTNSQHVTHLKGASELATYQFNFTVYASLSSGRNALSEVLRNLLHTKQNLVVSVTAGSINIKSIQLRYCSDGYSDMADGTENGAFVRDMFFDVTFFETAPTGV